MLNVTLNDAKDFSRVWTNRGVAIVLQDVHLQFAADFANVVLKSFIETAKQAQQAQVEAALKASLPKITLSGGTTEQPPPVVPYAERL
jgi:hypothetical protein